MRCRVTSAAIPDESRHSIAVATVVPYNTKRNTKHSGASSDVDVSTYAPNRRYRGTKLSLIHSTTGKSAAWHNDRGLANLKYDHSYQLKSTHYGETHGKHDKKIPNA